MNIPETWPSGERTHITVCGDTHGQYYDTLNIFALNGFPSPENPYLFNGVCVMCVCTQTSVDGPTAACNAPVAQLPAVGWVHGRLLRAVRRVHAVLVGCVAQRLGYCLCGPPRTLA